jgi:hypothetical protein
MNFRQRSRRVALQSCAAAATAFVASFSIGQAIAQMLYPPYGYPVPPPPVFRPPPSYYSPREEPILEEPETDDMIYERHRRSVVRDETEDELRPRLRRGSGSSSAKPVAGFTRDSTRRALTNATLSQPRGIAPASKSAPPRSPASTKVSNSPAHDVAPASRQETLPTAATPPRVATSPNANMSHTPGGKLPVQSVDAPNAGPSTQPNGASPPSTLINEAGGKSNIDR